MTDLPATAPPEALAARRARLVDASARAGLGSILVTRPEHLSTSLTIALWSAEADAPIGSMPSAYRRLSMAVDLPVPGPPINADNSSDNGIVTLSRKPPVQDSSRISARRVPAGSVTDTRVAGVRTASMRLSRRSELTLNHDDAPGLARSFGPITSSA